MMMSSSLPLVFGIAVTLVGCSAPPKSTHHTPQKASTLAPPGSVSSTGGGTRNEPRGTQSPHEPGPEAAKPAQSATLTNLPFLSALDVQADMTLAKRTLRLHIRGKDGPFGELTRRGLAKTVEGGTLLVQVPTAYPESDDAVLSEHRDCSYVMDCSAAVFESIGLEQLGSTPDSAKLIEFANRHIAKKALSRGFDLASEVALSREGDCSEHAVFLAAISRLKRRPARVVFGFAVLHVKSQLPRLMGHAWAEIHDGKAWRLADAALADLNPKGMPLYLGLSYLPMQVLRREDAGFRVALMAEPGPAQVEKADARPEP